MRTRSLTAKHRGKSNHAGRQRATWSTPCRHGRHGHDLRRNLPAVFRAVADRPLYERTFGICEVELAAVASRTGRRAEAYRRTAPAALSGFRRVSPSPTAVDQLLAAGVDFVCVATPDDRHFEAARKRPRGRQARADRKTVGAVARRTRRTRSAWPGERGRAGQGRLSQAARPRPQEAAHAGGRRRAEARQQRLLHAAGAQDDLRRASSPSGSAAAIPARTWPCTTSS